MSRLQAIHRWRTARRSEWKIPCLIAGFHGRCGMRFAYEGMGSPNDTGECPFPFVICFICFFQQGPSDEHER